MFKSLYNNPDPINDKALIPATPVTNGADTIAPVAIAVAPIAGTIKLLTRPPADLIILLSFADGKLKAIPIFFIISLVPSSAVPLGSDPFIAKTTSESLT